MRIAVDEATKRLGERRNALADEHGKFIYLVFPKGTRSPGERIRYGQPEADIELIESIPLTLLDEEGWWFAKIVDLW